MELFTETGKPDAEPAARRFVMLRDGAMSAGCLADPSVIGKTFLRGVSRHPALGRTLTTVAHAVRSVVVLTVQLPPRAQRSEPQVLDLGLRPFSA